MLVLVLPILKVSFISKEKKKMESPSTTEDGEIENSYWNNFNKRNSQLTEPQKGPYYAHFRSTTFPLSFWEHEYSLILELCIYSKFPSPKWL